MTRPELGHDRDNGLRELDELAIGVHRREAWRNTVVANPVDLVDDGGVGVGSGAFPRHNLGYEAHVPLTPDNGVRSHRIADEPVWQGRGHDVQHATHGRPCRALNSAGPPPQDPGRAAIQGQGPRGVR